MLSNRYLSFFNIIHIHCNLTLFTFLLATSWQIQAQNSGKLFWSQQSRTLCMDLHDGNVSNSFPIVHNPSDINLDINNGKMYWIDVPAKKIQSANIDGANVKDLIVSNGDSLGRLALDLINAKMYWVNFSTTTNFITTRTLKRANIDGTNEEILITEFPLVDEIAVDGIDGKIYWKDKESSSIYRANPDGSEVEELISNLFGSIYSIVLDLEERKIYFGGDGFIRKANLDGTNIEMVVEVDSWTRSMVVDHKDNKLFWLEGSPSNVIRCSNRDGTNVEEIVEASSLAIKIGIDTSGDKIYWYSLSRQLRPPLLGNIHRANLDGTEVEDVLLGQADPDSLAVDLANGKAYWRSSFDDTIRRANLDGSDSEIIITSGKGGSLALDLINGKLYWANSLDQKIQRANLDGSNIEDLIMGSANQIALDVGGSTIYWLNSSGLFRSQLDGKNVRQVLQELIPSSKGVALDLRAMKLYWNNRNKIKRANLDGTDVEDVISEGISSLGTKFVIAPSNGKLYWARPQGIHQANLDGTGVETLVDFSFPLGDVLAMTFADDEQSFVEFSSPLSVGKDALENTHEIFIKLSLPQGDILRESISVDISDSGTGTATSNIDYLFPSPQTVVFPAGSEHGTMQRLNVTLLNDNETEDLETVIFSLSGLQSSVENDIQANHKLIISDNGQAALLAFDSPNSLMIETGSNYTVSVELSLLGTDMLHSEVSVDIIDTEIGSAIAGLDYLVNNPSRLTFPVGSEVGTILSTDITILTDTFVEENETIVLELTNIQGPAINGNVVSHEIGIVDDSQKFIENKGKYCNIIL